MPRIMGIGWWCPSCGSHVKVHYQGDPAAEYKECDGSVTIEFPGRRPEGPVHCLTCEDNLADLCYPAVGRSGLGPWPSVVLFPTEGE